MGLQAVSVGAMLEQGLACSSQVLEGFASALEPALSSKSDDGERLSDWLLRASPEGTGVSLQQAISEVQHWDINHLVEVATWLRDFYFSSGLASVVEHIAEQAEVEFKFLGSHLASGDAASVSARLEGRVDAACSRCPFLNGTLARRNYTKMNVTEPKWCFFHKVAEVEPFNSTRLSIELERLNRKLEDWGIYDWVAGRNLSEASIMVHRALELLQHGGMPSVQDSVRKSGPSSTAKAIDELTWWLSYFLEPTSPTAMALRVLGEADIAAPKRSVDLETPLRSKVSANVMAALVRWEHEVPRKEINDAVKDAVDVAMAILRNGTDEEAVRRAVEAAADAAAARLDSVSEAQALRAAVYRAVNASWDEARKVLRKGEEYGIMDHVRKFLDKLAHRNASSIMEEWLPDMQRTWRNSCPKFIANRSDFRSKVEKTQRGCPFYRSAVRKLSSWPALREVAQAHRDLGDLNFLKYVPALTDWQNDLKAVNGTEVGSMVKNLLRKVQRQRLDPADTKKVAHSVAKTLRDEWLIYRKMAPCSGSGPRSWGARRLQFGGGSSGSDSTALWLQQQLLSRKILVAPNKGESKQMIEFLAAEAVTSLFTPTNGTFSYFVQALVRCPLVKAAAAKAATYLLNDRMIHFANERELEAYAEQYPNSVLAGLVFRSADPTTGDFPAGELKLEYAIRAHSAILPSTSGIVRLARSAMFGGTVVDSQPYLYTGVAYLQELIGRCALRLRSARAEAAVAEDDADANVRANGRMALGRRLTVAVEQFPAPAYSEDAFIRLIQFALPMIMVLGWIYAVSLLVKEIVYEKQERLRDVMRIMGLRNWAYWASWMLSAMVQMTGLVLLMTLILCGSKVLKHSNPSLIFVFFWLYSLSTVSFSLLISAFFSRAKVAAACAGILYYVAYLPYSLFNRFEDVLPLAGKNALCLLSPTGLGIGLGTIAKLEMIGEGAQWRNLGKRTPFTNSGATPKDAHGLGHVFLMFIIDAIVYQVLAWYIEKVFPGTLGLPQPWYFPFLKSYWFPPAHSVSDLANGAMDEREGNGQLECWEPAPDGVAAAVQIRGLKKVFPGGKQALKGISLDMHEGFILGLLGHNGAGKSTTMAILTGLYPPTDGDVLVHGVSVRKDSHGVRRQLGVCLQQNALYENFTVEEHLRLFTCLKSVPADRVQAEVETLLQDTGLLPKRRALSKALSGGMKRKLSIGIALAGESRVITLDEPTAGVDASSRRDIWHLLAAAKHRRTILLSTHFMDEADVLSDRIAIIAEGRLTAIGNSLSLKRHFAEGYMLTVVMANHADTARLMSAVATIVPEARCAGARGRELSFVLPFGARGRFAELFTKLQDDGTRAALGVDAYGLSAASMEDVFLAASSIHEEGLHGVVRNGVTPALQQALGDQSPSDDGSSTAEGESDSGSRPSSGSGSRARPDTPESTGSPTGSHSPVGVDSEFASGLSPASSDVGSEAGKNSENEATVWPEKDADATPSTTVPSPRKVPKALKSKVAGKVPAAEVEPAPREAWKPTASPKLIEGPRLVVQQFEALFRKRALFVRRDRKAWASQLLLPAFFVLLALVIARILAVKSEDPPLLLNTDMFVGTYSRSRGGTVSLKEHVIPMAGACRRPAGGAVTDPLGDRVRTAFEAAKGASDRLDTLSCESSMGPYFLANSRDLSATYSGISVAGGAATKNVTLWYKGEASHAIPAMVSMWNNARFRLTGFSGSTERVWSHPLPKTQEALLAENTGQSQVFTDLTVAITVILAMGFIPASFVVHMVHERASNGKHQQLLTGVSPALYWLASYVWDLVNFVVPLLFCFVLFLAFQVNAYSGENAGPVFLLLLFYGVCMTPFMYCLEPIFTVSSTAYVTLICINIFTGTVSVLSTTVMDMYEDTVPSLAPINALSKAIYPWLLPNYSLGRGLIDLATNYYQNWAASQYGLCLRTQCKVDPMSWNVAGKFLFALIVMTPFWLGLRLLIEWGFCSARSRPRRGAQASTLRPADQDPAVTRERERVAAAVAGAKGAGKVSDSLVLSDLQRSFVKRSGCGKSTFNAVRGVDVGVAPGECFGLLGVNGAGKTTTMRMITGHIDIGEGDILVGGWNLKKNKDKARRHLGYCPQFDALPDKLTVRETLNLYSRIRGIPRAELESTVETMIQRMCLEAHQHNTCEHLSGGNKRKLSTALALIGEPDVVLLDEPSTGVDVGARRFLWDLVSDVRRGGKAVVLTSHSMEECEVLCTRLTIMSHGQLRCLGSPLELKEKYGGGYTLTIKASLNQDGRKDGSEEAVNVCERIMKFLKAKLPMAELAEENVGLLRYRLGQHGAVSAETPEEPHRRHPLPLGDVFRVLEEATAEGGELQGCVSDYSLSQTSLEEVFLFFSREAEAGGPTLTTVGMPAPSTEVELIAESPVAGADEQPLEEEEVSKVGPSVVVVVSM